VKTGKKYFCLGQLLPSSILVLFRNPQEAPASTTIPLTRAGSRFGAAPCFFPGRGAVENPSHWSIAGRSFP
jgi:hypothetical protein